MCEKNFGIPVTTEQANRLYEKNTQGWFGDGEIYSVWQYDDGAVLETLLPWQQGNGFQQQLYQQVVKAAEPDAYYQPRALEQDVFYYLQNHDTDGHGDDQILFIYTPQITLGDGLQYKKFIVCVRVVQLKTEKDKCQVEIAAIVPICYNKFI